MGSNSSGISARNAKKNAENDRLGTFHNHNLPCELRDADPHERDLTENLDDEQIAEWRLNQGDELIVENLRQDIAYEDYLAEGDSLMELVSAGLFREEKTSEDADTCVFNADLREFFNGPNTPLDFRRV